MDLDTQQNLLPFYLENLPASLPIPRRSAYGFSSFEVDPEWVADTGEIGAINQVLEVQLGSRKEPLKIKE